MTVINLGDHAVIHWENKSFTLAERPLFLEKAQALLNGTKKHLLIDFSGLEFLNAGVISGRWINASDWAGRRNVCCLPEQPAERLFPTRTPSARRSASTRAPS